MSSKPWYPRYPRDFRAKTMHLDLTERGAYNSLLDHYYELQHSLPCDPDALYRIAGAFKPEERAAVDRVSREFFSNGDGKLTNARAEEEIAKMRARSEQQSELAKRRWEGNAKAYAKAKPKRSQGNASHSHSHISQSQVTPTKTKTTRAKARCVCPEDFGTKFSPSMQEWLKDVTQVKAHLIHFVGYAKANGKMYSDWEQAFQNAIRDDWAGVRKVTQ